MEESRRTTDHDGGGVRERKRMEEKAKRDCGVSQKEKKKQSMQWLETEKSGGCDVAVEKDGVSVDGGGQKEESGCGLLKRRKKKKDGGEWSGRGRKLG